MVTRVLILMVLVLPAGAMAVDMTNYRTAAPPKILQTTRSMYDVERCAVEIDGPALASVYRQPDRPSEVRIAWGPGETGGVSVLQLDGVENTRLTFWGRAKVWERITAACRL